MKIPAQVDALDTDIIMIYTKTLIFLIQRGLVGISSWKDREVRKFFST